ncbi:MAG: sensor histidine kinase [Deltaproteobacteria bacterium]|nr:MAG: sensor histidine kinase [Deltaproteobacteria bacterium]
MVRFRGTFLVQVGRSVLQHHNGGNGKMKKSLRTIILAFYLASFAAVISVGGISTYMVHRIVGEISLLKNVSKAIFTIDMMHNKSYHLVLSIHHFIIARDYKNYKRAINLLDNMESDAKKYIQHEESSGEMGSREQLRLVGLIQDNLKEIKILIPLFEDISTNKTRDVPEIVALEKYAYNIEILTNEINKIHLRDISRGVKVSQGLLSSIFTLFSVLSIAGILSIYIGYRLHGRYIIKPIDDLADATRKLSMGDLSIRVSSNDKTEIGTLYHSFNAMTERLQDYEKKLMDFNRSLEQKVNERTHELKHAYDTLKKTQENIIRLEKTAALGQISASVNHEIKTPLNSLYMNLQLLKKQVNQSGGVFVDRKKHTNEIIDIMGRETLRISGILDEFVRYARLAPLNMKENDLNKIVSETADMISQRAEHSGVRLQMNLSDTVTPFSFDDEKITQCLINLFINAINAMGNGGILTVETGPVENNMIRLIVSDTGAGIKEDIIDKIFQPFFSKHKDGLGLGLPIAQGIVEGHGGKISCRSKVGEGTTFEILLPTDMPPGKEEDQE